jgi:transcriptional regulator with PAS, ATPase and Fis domain
VAAPDEIIGEQHRERAAEEGCFREDRFFRIHVLALEFPPLRARPSGSPRVF